MENARSPRAFSFCAVFDRTVERRTKGGLAQRVRAKRGPMTGSGVIRRCITPGIYPVKQTTTKKKGYTAKDMRVVSDNPEWTEADFARAEPFRKVFRGLRKSRGPEAPTKKQ
jgi:hypothetical protein